MKYVGWLDKKNIMSVKIYQQGQFFISYTFLNFIVIVELQSQLYVSEASLSTQHVCLPHQRSLVRYLDGQSEHEVLNFRAQDRFQGTNSAILRSLEAGRTTLFLVGSYPPRRLFKNSSTGLPYGASAKRIKGILHSIAQSGNMPIKKLNKK